MGASEVAIFSWRSHDMEYDWKSWCKEWGKYWAFQHEKGEETGRDHYQGIISLKVKGTVASLKKTITPLPNYFAPLSNANIKGGSKEFYVTKVQTRVAGPWTDRDVEPPYIPRQIRAIKTLYPWQTQVIADREIWNTRNINIIFDKIGNSGKTTLKGYIGAHQLGRFIPFVNDYKDMMRMVMDTKKESLYIIDIPRAIKKEKLFQFYAGIESLKDGYAYDDRYKFRDEHFDCPNVWVFTNKLPDRKLLSADRWRFWEINAEKELVKINPENIFDDVEE